MVVGEQTYHDVRLLNPCPYGLVIRYRGGFTTVPWDQLPPDLREYYTAVWSRQEAAALSKPQPSPALPRRWIPPDGLRSVLGEPPELRLLVDLRPAFARHGLAPKDQGRRPSCSVFAAIGAVEYLTAQYYGQPVHFSEDYLIWATRKSLALTDAEVARRAAAAGLGEDLGFALHEVFQAMEHYGVATQEEMPNTFGGAMSQIREPNSLIQMQARSRGQFRALFFMGRTPKTVIGNCVHALNQDLPVAVGIRIPTTNRLGNDTRLGERAPVGGHAVTLVGYECKTGRLEDTVFIFRNSWGPNWGEAGYGFVSYAYLERYLGVAAALEPRTR